MGLILLCPALAWGQIATNEPSIGYVYPAGGRQGTSIQITVGGQNLRGLSKVYISGKGTSVSNIIYVPPMSRLQFQELQRRVTEIRNNRLGLPKVEGAAPAPSPAAALTPAPALNPTPTPSQLQPVETPKPVTLPDHPLLKDLDRLSLTELKQVLDFFNPNRKQQIKRSIQELAIVDISIDADASSGSRELRLATPVGLTNPVCFQVGTMPESMEKEPNDVDTSAMQALDLPVLLNGQIMPGDVDRFRFRARQGQRLVIEAQARRLIPYLPDAVPGWFQAVLALYDAAGKEVAYVDDYLTGPDPVMFYDVPQDGEYVAEIRDAIYRGREDFVYRVSIQMRNADFKLRNSDEARISALEGALPEIAEHEPNDTFQKAQPAPLPQVVSGCIARPGDIDVYRFEGRAGDEITAEVYARRLDSPLDALLRLTDASGRVLAWSDDAVDKGSGLVTHHADSYIRFKLPKAGSYLIQLSDAQNQGGSEYIYRLRLSPLRPDFELRITPSGISIPAGGAVPVCVYALRRDGFNGDIRLALKDAPDGFALSGGVIPAGRDIIRMTLTAPKKKLEAPVTLQLTGGAVIGGRTVSRPAVAAEDMMQAFDYRHLVPAEAFTVAVMNARAGTAPELSDNNPVNIPAGGEAKVKAKVKVPPRVKFTSVYLELSEPPKGISLSDVQMSQDEMTFTLKAAAGQISPGYADNLIIDFSADIPAGGQDAKTVRRVYMGVLPAIPVKVGASVSGGSQNTEVRSQ